MQTTSRARTTSMLFTLAIAALATGCMEVRVPDPDVRYVAFGDSSTSGADEPAYPQILRERLDEPAESFSNEGSGGETSGQGLERLRMLIENEIFPNGEVLLYWEGAAEVVNFIGSYDRFLLFSPSVAGYPYSAPLESLLDDTQSNIEAAVRLGQDAGLDVYVATYFPIRASATLCPVAPINILLPGQAAIANDYIDLLNERIRAAAMNEGAVLVDIAAREDELTSTPANYFDCNHLSAEGNAVVADAFFEVIEAAAHLEPPSGEK